MMVGGWSGREFLLQESGAQETDRIATNLALDQKQSPTTNTARKKKVEAGPSLFDVHHTFIAMGKKQFIDRKNARHFHLVHRSQRDPLSRDESAPQRVLKEVIPANLVGKVKPLESDEDPFADDQGVFSDDDGDDGINYGTYNRAIEEVELLEAPTKGKKKTSGKNEE
jgi:hypothetical protein